MGLMVVWHADRWAIHVEDRFCRVCPISYFTDEELVKHGFGGSEVARQQNIDALRPLIEIRTKGMA